MVVVVHANHPAEIALDCPPDTGLPYPTGSAADLEITVKAKPVKGKKVKGKVTVISSRPMSSDAVYETFLAVLAVAAYAGAWLAVPACCG